jgi:hypothetical protein
VAVFDANAFAFLAALPTFRAQANALAVDVQTDADLIASMALAMALPNYAGTSTTTNAVGTGPKSFVTQSGKGWAVGQVLVVSNGNNYMSGTVTAYTGSALDINVATISGSGTFSSWSIAVSFNSIPGLAESGTNTDIASLGGLTTYPYIPVRQTVLSGPVDTSGLPAFGGSTGSTTVTASGTLIATAANGSATIGTIDRVGSIVNPSWTGLSTNGTMFLYLDIAADGTCTTGSTTLAPTYRWGGADVTTNNQFTFNIQEMIGKVGNGSVAAQTYRVFVGEVTVAGGLVTAITWYALRGRYDITDTADPSTTAISKNHNLGILPRNWSVRVVCTTADASYSVGDEVNVSDLSSSTANNKCASSRVSRSYISVISNTGSLFLPNLSTGTWTALTAGSWSTRFVCDRGW